jgi:hypothetical protein
MELLPLPLAAVLARIFLTWSALGFVVACSLMIGLWILAYRLRLARRDLESRLRELDTLHKIGQAVATGPELDILLNTIYLQVSQLMEADHFYAALYDASSEILTFPLVRRALGSERYPSAQAVLIRQTGHHNLNLEVIGQPPLWLVFQWPRH